MSCLVAGGEIVCEGAGNNYAIGNDGTVSIESGYITAKYGSDNWGLATSPYALYGSGSYTITGGYVKAVGNKDQSQAGHLFGDSAQATISAGYFGGTYFYGLKNDGSQLASGCVSRKLTSSESNATDAAAYAAGYLYVVEAQ